MENRERRIRDSYAMLESHLTLLGVTGIEDKLQAGVPETMAALIAAGIVVWVLTGSWKISRSRASAQTGLTSRRARFFVQLFSREIHEAFRIESYFP